ncbi:MAG: hypothetical protein ACREFY_02425 [Acetobacteraceae bacterium]
MGKAHRMAAVPIYLTLGLGLGGCAARPLPHALHPTPAARRTPAPALGVVGRVVALRPVPRRTLGADPAAFRTNGAPAEEGSSGTYTEIVIREPDGRTRVVVQPMIAGLAPGRQVRLVRMAGLAVLVPGLRQCPGPDECSRDGRPGSGH